MYVTHKQFETRLRKRLEERKTAPVVQKQESPAPFVAKPHPVKKPEPIKPIPSVPNPFVKTALSRGYDEKERLTAWEQAKQFV